MFKLPPKQKTSLSRPWKSSLKTRERFFFSCMYLLNTRNRFKFVSFDDFYALKKNQSSKINLINIKMSVKVSSTLGYKLEITLCAQIVTD